MGGNMVDPRTLENVFLLPGSQPRNIYTDSKGL